MKFSWSIPGALRPFYEQELRAYRKCSLKGDMPEAWTHLERAHILGQPYPREHTFVHFKMLLFGMRTHNAREVVGQIPRLLVGGIKSWAGAVPLGNTGRANVPALKPMPISDDLQAILWHAKTEQ